ncbi:hypothetical protein POTOM_060508 [Populus tomentosa]|uniref:Uncharacterized protein n=1 Tax=Populus tomentosa TaxID=118781 RepID=A0A8X7XT89_POPTO|nr:hypothetical protein POTOM_060508 [Populus tomentosa]
MSPLSAFSTFSDSVLVDSGMKFMDIIEDILAQLTPMAVTHFGANVLTRISQLFDKYMDMLIKSLPGPSDDDNLTELKEVIHFRAKTDSEQLALLGLAFTILDELLPLAIIKVWSLTNESKELESENIVPNASITAELKEWKRSLQHSFDKLRDHFCRQYALFARLQQLATVAGDVLLGKEKIQKILLARLTETVVMWLSGRNSGMCLRMNQFHLSHLACSSALPEDEWFVETAKTAINNFC